MMVRLLSGAAVGALIISMVATGPARANDVVAAAIGVKLLVGATLLATRDTGGTSANTQYALTGVGHPETNGRVNMPKHVAIHCNAHGTHCRTVETARGW